MTLLALIRKLAKRLTFHRRMRRAVMKIHPGMMNYWAYPTGHPIWHRACRLQRLRKGYRAFDDSIETLCKLAWNP